MDALALLRRLREHQQWVNARLLGADAVPDVMLITLARKQAADRA